MRTQRIHVISLFAAVALLLAGSTVAQAASDQQATTGHAQAAGSGRSAQAGAATPVGVSDAAARRQQQRLADDMTGDITYSVPSGTFQGSVSVSLSTTVSGAQIRYTTDGQPPTASSTVYSSPLQLTATTQLRAQAFVDGTASGEPGTALYTARSVDATSDLPLLVMDAYGKGKPDRDYADVSTMLMEPQGGSSSLAQTPTVATRAGFHLHGQSSANFDKAPYRLELRDNDDDDADYPLAGMPADSDWVLRGPYPDKTLIRDAFGYQLGQTVGLKTPRYRFVELYLNLDGSPLSADDYQGVYMLDETIKRSSDRLDIQKLKKTDLTEPAITGGYIMKFNAYAAEDPKLPCTGDQSTCWKDLEVDEPAPEDIQSAQTTWLAQYVQKFHDALHGSDPSNASTGYPAYIDVDSFVDMIIVNELSREGDAYIRSTYFYKDRGGKLVAGPLWDYDLGFDAVPGSNSVSGWQYKPFFPGFATTDWFLKLMQDPTFNQRVVTRWTELRQGALSDTQLKNTITQLSTPLTAAAQRNFTKWPILDTQMVGGFQTQTTGTWAEQIQLMQNWITQRAAWIDSSGWRVDAQ